MNRSHRTDVWLPEFHSLLEGHSAMAFEWGVHDCATVAAKVLTISGHDHDYDPTEWVSARTVIEMQNHLSLLHRLIDILGDPIPWGNCIVGDIAIAIQESESARRQYIVAVFDGSRFLVPDERGFMEIPVSDLLVGWRV